MLEVELDRKVFRSATGVDLAAIENLHFSVQPGTVTCIVGPSGCGKTTTLRILMGLDTEYDGRVRVDGEARLAAVFQEPRLLPWRTVEENVTLAFAAHETVPPLDELFDVLGLAQVRTFYPGELSLGLARRVALARAFAIEPDLLMLDEPFVSLDDATALRLRALLIELLEARPTTALMVTHNLHEAATFADAVLVFSDRPTSVVATLPVDVPRTERSASQIEALVHELERLQRKHRNAVSGVSNHRSSDAENS